MDNTKRPPPKRQPKVTERYVIEKGQLNAYLPVCLVCS